MMIKNRGLCKLDSQLEIIYDLSNIISLDETPQITKERIIPILNNACKLAGYLLWEFEESLNSNTSKE